MNVIEREREGTSGSVFVSEHKTEREREKENV